LSLSFAAAVAAGLVACGSDASPTTAVPSQPVPVSAIPRLTAMADRAVKVNGGLPVAWATVVVTTRAKALTSATPGDSIPNDQRTVVYLVTIKGHFTAYLYSGPPGSHAPTGTYLSEVIDATTFAGLDSGLGSKPPPVSPASLGPVTYLNVHPLGHR
jgi:hypothetical protein